MHCVIVSYLVHSFSNDYKIKTKTDDFYKFESVSCRFKSETLHSFTMWVARSDWRTASNVTIRVAESLSEGVGGFWWSRIPNNTRGRSRIFFVRLRLWKFNWIFFYFTLLSWEFLLKWYNFFWNFYWNREFLLCTTVSIDWWALQNCWQPSFIHVMLWSRRFLERAELESNTPPPDPANLATMTSSPTTTSNSPSVKTTPRAQRMKLMTSTETGAAPVRQYFTLPPTLRWIFLSTTRAHTWVQARDKNTLSSSDATQCQAKFLASAKFLTYYC